MVEIIFYILICASLANYVSWRAEFVQKLKRVLMLSRVPVFYCANCFAFWFSFLTIGVYNTLIYFDILIKNIDISILEYGVIIMLSGWAAEYMEKIFRPRVPEL
jgi:hypothetical protein